jgi:hypothetical protein
MQPATHIATAPTRRKARGEELVSGLNMMGSDRWFRLVTSAASNGCLATTAHPLNRVESREISRIYANFGCSLPEPAAKRGNHGRFSDGPREKPPQTDQSSQSFRPLPPFTSPREGETHPDSRCDHSRAAEKPSDGNQ